MPHGFQKAHEERQNPSVVVVRNARDVVDPIAEQQSEYRRYAAVSFLMFTVMSAVSVISIVLAKPQRPERFARDLEFNATGINGTQLAECPVNRDWVNASVVVEACKMMADYCANSSLLNNTFQFMLNITCNITARNECLEEPPIDFIGRCINTDVRGTDWGATALFFVGAAAFLGLGIAYSVRASRVGAPSIDSSVRPATRSEDRESLVANASLTVRSADELWAHHRDSGNNNIFSFLRRQLHSINGEGQTPLLPSLPTPKYGAADDTLISPREKW